MAKRIALLAYDLLAPLLAAAVVVLVAAPQAHAYVDPSVMTYTIQAVAGVAVALSAVLGVALRRTRKILFRVLKIDENANKVVEPVVCAVSPDDADAPSALEEADRLALKDKTRIDKGPEARTLSWPQRFLRALAACCFLVLTVFIAAPLEMVAGSADSLNFGFFNALPIVLFAGAVAILALALLVSLVRGRVFDVVITVIVALGLGCYVQSLLFNGPLPVADGSSLDLMKFKKITLVSTVVWIALFVGLLLLNAKKKTVCRPLAMIICCCLIIMQGASLVSIGTEQRQLIDENGEESVLTDEGLFEVSGEDNVIVFVLDFFDTQVLEQILQDDPNTLDEFTGFTYFKNSTGSMIPTRFGVPFLLTGEMPQDGDTYEGFLEARYDRSTFIEDIANAGYNVDLYTDSLRTNKLDSFANNIVTTSELEMDAPRLLMALAKMSLYRESPWLLKPFFWFNTDEINGNSISSDLNPYLMDDIAYGERLATEGISVAEAGKSFKFIHLLGAHFPYIMDAEGKLAESETDQPTQGHGSLMIVANYLKQLKAAGLYDSAAIIVTSDHGNWYLTDEPIDRPTTPILLVKPSEDASEASEPLRVSTVPTGHLDFNATVIDAVGGDASSYGPTVFDIDDSPRPRYYWMTTSNGKQDIDWLELEIDGDVLDFDNWSLTGKKIPILPEDER